jgi:stearoyl-CoA desaturase (delta-9 desaturase)
MHIDPDKWLDGNIAKKLKINFAVSHLIILYWILTDFTWWGLAAGIAAYVFIGKVGADIGFHRYFTHRSFEVKPWLRKYLLWNATIIGHGSVLLWVATHRIHHAKADTDTDPHSPTHHGLITTWLRSWTTTNKPNMMLMKDIMRDQEIILLHRNYFKVFYAWILILIALSLIFSSIYPILFLFAFPNAGFFNEAGMINSIGHLWGYTPYATKDNSKNNLFVNILTFGNGLHNTHHAKPNLYTCDVRGKWYETDPMKYIIKLIANDGSRVENKV